MEIKLSEKDIKRSYLFILQKNYKIRIIDSAMYLMGKWKDGHVLYHPEADDYTWYKVE